jgi:histidyl-tRNA synthetase
MLARLWKQLGIADVELHINSIGDAEARARHRVDLVKYFEAHLDQLDEDARRRLHSNPLRTLDSKNPRLQHLLEAAPKLADYLDDAAREHFTALQALLDAAGIGFVVDPRLVRGFDYYNRTVFEWITTRLGSQGTIAGGGRYDGLIEELGGKAAPACGFAMGVERIVLLMKEYQFVAPARPADAYIVYVGDGTAAQALRLAESLRDAGLVVLMHAGGGNFKTQMKKADSSGARFAIIIGPEELAAGEVSLKPLRAADAQVRIAPTRVAEIIQQSA